MIPKRNLGGRHSCPVCGARFYDLNREEIRCPKCGVSITDDSKVDPRTAAMARLKAENQARKAGVGESDDDADLVDEDEILDFSDEDEDLETPEGDEDEEPISEDFDDA
ncbi:MAG: TIGR02300 family protein [Deltaproteobacteria bacterium]|nr:TIGR02300 family protein [Deltaproteobacteria bacterium]